MSKLPNVQDLGSSPELNLTQAAESSTGSSPLPPLPRTLRRHSSSETTSKELDEEVAAAEELALKLKFSAEASRRLQIKIKNSKEEKKQISENAASEKALLNQRLAEQQDETAVNEAKLKKELEEIKNSLKIQTSRAEKAETLLTPV